MNHSSTDLRSLLDPGQRDRVLRRKGEDALYRETQCWRCPQCDQRFLKRIPEAAKEPVRDSRIANKARNYPVRKLLDSKGRKCFPSFTITCKKNDFAQELQKKWSRPVTTGSRGKGYWYWVQRESSLSSPGREPRHLGIFFYAHKIRRGFHFSVFLVDPERLADGKQGNRNFELTWSSDSSDPKFGPDRIFD